MFDDTYVGVTGQTIHRRKMQHYKSERFPDGFHLEIIATAESRHRINQIEMEVISERKPSLNQRKGGNSVGGYYSRRKSACRHGFNKAEATSKRCPDCAEDRVKYQNAYYERVTKKKRQRKRLQISS